MVTSETRPHPIPVEPVVPSGAGEFNADAPVSMADIFIAVARTVLVGGTIVALCYWGYHYLAQPISPNGQTAETAAP